MVIEALASGLPVLVSDQGGPRELLRNPADGEVIAGDAAAWEKAIRKILGQNRNDEERRARRERTVRGRSWDEALLKFWEQGQCVS